MTDLFKDEDGATLRLERVGGFGQPMLAMFIFDEYDDLCGINVTVPHAELLIASLQKFLKHAYPQEDVVSP